MGRKKVLEKRLARLQTKKQNLATRAQASQDANEVRSINEQLEEVNAEIAETKEELDAISEEERGGDPTSNPDEGGEQRSNPPQNAQLVNANIVGAFGQQTNVSQQRQETDPYATMEYRRAFMRYAQTGEAIPTELIQRNGTVANTNTLGATIPTTILDEFIDETRKVYGNIYSKVRKLSIPGGVKIPVAKLQATFKWISEGTTSPKQDGGKIDEYIEFSYNMAEIRVAQTLLSSIVTIDLFEREIIKVMLKAYMQAMDTVIINGTGNGQPLGILKDTRVTGQSGNIIEMSEADINNWTAWRKKFFAKLPLGYRTGEFVFPIATVDAYLETMSDSNNNPIFRQATGLEVDDKDTREPNGRFFGHNISLVEPDIIKDFDSANSGDVIGIFWQPEEYAVNTSMEFGMKRWFDEDANEWVNKMITIVDGKVLNPKGFYIFKKK